MATKEEKQELIEILKFTPRTYKISMWGYGGEKVMGTVDPKVWDYCMDNQVNLQDIAWSDEDTVTEDMGLDIDLLPFPPGSWYECDDMAHINGVSRDAGTLQIEDENGETVIEESLDNFNGGENSPGWCCNEEIWVGMRSKGEVVFIGSSNEKGTFFEGDIELKMPFDIEKLELHYDEVDGEEIINAVYYDGEEIENYGGSTDGKSSDMNMVKVIDDNGNWERYEPEEKDWGHPEMGWSPSDWESSPKIKFKDQKPTHPGYYSVNWGHGTTYGSLYWDGENFGEWEYGRFNPVNQDGVVVWSGYNWDTSDWANRPAEPPAYICKKCKWTGSREELREDEDYNDHCPECDSKKVEYIDYDPNSAKGRKNRDKYCIPPMPSIADYHPNVLKQALEELAEESAPAAKWPFSTATSTDTEEEEVTEEKQSKWWTVKTYHKKNCEQIEYFVQRNGDGRITVTDGFRWCTYNVETNDGEFPRFDFQKVPGGNDACDSLDMNSLSGDNIENSELVEMFDGGCWGGWEIEGVSEEEEEKLNEFLEENGSYALEDDGEWYLDETEVWVWGPILVTDEDGNERIIIADENGNVTDFKDE